MPYHLVVTASIKAARESLAANQNMQIRGKNRGTLPDGKEVLIMLDGDVEQGARGLALSGYEYLLSGATNAHNALLDTRVV
jgi:hypothetical protein